MSRTRVVEAILNGLEITVDADTGCILRLSYPGVGTMLESRPERGGAIDLAYPLKEFEALRLASRFSVGARVTPSADALEIHWERLGPSREKFAAEGPVSATVRLAAAPDGKSVTMTAEVRNESERDVRQVIFPDLSGLLPFAGEDDTMFRTAGFSRRPFKELANSEYRESYQYLTDIGSYSVEYTAGTFDNMILRWMDLGGLQGGISLFPKRWGYEPQVPVRLHRSEVETKLRLLCRHGVTIKQGETWQSGEWILTPHRQGWAEGIEPYRAWVELNYTREYPLPKHVRDDIGFRTVWMCQNVPADPEDAIFTFKDLPQLAAECKEHGINEMVLWGWHRGFTLPIPGPYPHLGTEQEMVDAIKECRRIGVNVVPFVSICLVDAETAPRYGLTDVGSNTGWTYHTEMVPRWNPPYAHGFANARIAPYPATDGPQAESSFPPLWCADCVAGANRLADMGIASLSWDGIYTNGDPEPNQISVIRGIRDYARQIDPDSTFSGEQMWNVEANLGVIDYTWNWFGYEDYRPFASLIPAPRYNLNISSSGLAVKKAFADNRYINVTPRKPESVNSSDYIANHPELSKALKQCAKLRMQFLPYFIEGKLIGECLLAAPVEGLHASAYVLPGRALLVLVNLSAEGPFSVGVDLAPWTGTDADAYEMRHYDAEGALLSKEEASGRWQGQTKQLAPEELTILEFVAR